MSEGTFTHIAIQTSLEYSKICENLETRTVYHHHSEGVVKSSSA